MGSRAQDAPSNWLPGDVATDGPWTMFQVARIKMIMNSVTVDTKISRLLALLYYHSSSRCCWHLCVPVLQTKFQIESQAFRYRISIVTNTLKNI